MFLKLTNIVPAHLGEPIIINGDAIVSVYNVHEEGGSLSTRIFTTHGEFMVEESLYEIEKQLLLVKK